MRQTIILTKGFLVAFLGSIYILGFIISPYWVLPTSASVVLFYCALTIGIGAIWVFLSADSLQIEFSPRDAGLFLLLVFAILLLNYRALNSVLPFRGDEILHIERTQELAQRLPIAGPIIVVFLLVLFFFAGIRKRRWLILPAILLVAGAIFFYLGKNPFEDVIKTTAFFLRYPFINYWFYVVLPKLAFVIGSPYHEFLYRIVPVFSMIGVAWVFQSRTDRSNPWFMIAWGLAVATIPIVFYYSSILYIEPPAVFLMTIVCIDIDNLLHKDSREILKIPGWYALILVGFVKETTIPFLVCLLAVRMIVQLWTWRKEKTARLSESTWMSLLMGELRVAFAVMAPILLYLYFRTTLVGTRSFVPHPSNLFDPAIYPVIVRSFVEQFGLFLLFFIGGCVVLMRERDYSALLCYISMIGAILVFYILDNTAYVGYSRFNLFVLPPILAGSLRFIKTMTEQRRIMGTILMLAAIGSNLWLSPVHLDGVKTAYWGNYLRDTSEHYYPYQDALVWLKENYPNKRVLFTGLDFHYPFQFYWNKLNWKPKRAGMPTQTTGDERLAIENILSKAERENYDVIVYRVLDEALVLPDATGEFRVQLIKNSTHSLIVFYKP